MSTANMPLYAIPEIPQPKPGFAWLAGLKRRASRAWAALRALGRKTLRSATRLAGRLRLPHLIGKLRAAGTFVFAPASRLLRRAGVLPVVAAVLTSARGQRLVTAFGRQGLRVLRWAGRWVGHGLDQLLGLFGKPGRRAADWLHSQAHNARQHLGRLRPVLRRLAALFDPHSAQVRVAHSAASGAVLHRLLGLVRHRALRVLLEVLIVPGLLDGDLLARLRQRRSRRARTDQASRPATTATDQGKREEPAAQPRAVADVTSDRSVQAEAAQAMGEAHAPLEEPDGPKASSRALRRARQQAEARARRRGRG